MANLRVTQASIKSNLEKWSQGTGTTDEYIFHQSDGIDEKEVVNMAWQMDGMIVTISAYQNEFRKITFVEKL